MPSDATTQPPTGPEIIERVFAVVASKYRFSLPLPVSRTMIIALLDAIRDPSEAWSDDLIHGPILCAQIWRGMIDALRREIAG